MEELCFACNINKIEMKRRPLCKSCYQTSKSNGIMELFPLINCKEKTINGIMEKYGSKFLEDIESLRGGCLTLKKIGDIYGITRERIRQIYVRIYDEPYTVIVEKKKEYNKKAEEEYRLFRLHIERKLKRCKQSGNIFKATISEYTFYKKCLSLGYDVSMRTFGHHVYDSDVNGYKIEIKTSTHPKIYYKNSKQEYYHANIRKEQTDIIDFLAFYISDDDFWYIVPRSVLSGSEGFFAPKYGEIGRGRYQEIQKYREAWHLLENKDKAKIVLEKP
jgi:hypothetical protein